MQFSRWFGPVLAVLALLLVPVTWGVGQPAAAPSGIFRDLKKGYYVGLKDAGAAYEIIIYPAYGAPGAYEVVEVAPDYVTLRDMANIDAMKIPIYSVKSISALKAFPAQGRPGPAPYTPGVPGTR